MVLDSVENVHAHSAVHHVDGQPPFAKSTCAPNPVQVCLVVWVSILVDGQVKIDHHRNLLDVNAWLEHKQEQIKIKRCASYYSEMFILVTR